MTAPEPGSPMALFEKMRGKAFEMLKVSFMESERAWPGDEAPEVVGLFMPILGIGIAAAVEHFAHHPEDIALAGSPICTECRNPVETLHLQPRGGEHGDQVVKIAWPCGHTQAVTS